MNRKFKVEISLGNDAMLDDGDLADALADISRRVRAGECCGKVRDLNGNTVGIFETEVE